MKTYKFEADQSPKVSNVNTNFPCVSNVNTDLP